MVTRAPSKSATRENRRTPAAKGRGWMAWWLVSRKLPTITEGDLPVRKVVGRRESEKGLWQCLRLTPASSVAIVGWTSKRPQMLELRGWARKRAREGVFLFFLFGEVDSRKGRSARKGLGEGRKARQCKRRAGTRQRQKGGRRRRMRIEVSWKWRPETGERHRRTNGARRIAGRRRGSEPGEGGPEKRIRIRGRAREGVGDGRKE